VTHTSTEEQFAAAQKSLAEGDFLGAAYRWIRGGLFSGKKGCKFEEALLDNKLLNLKEETLEKTVELVLRGSVV